jgi:hypothetical protein
VQQKVQAVKSSYSKSLRNLEEISESIHAARAVKMKLRARIKEEAKAQVRNLYKIVLISVFSNYVVNRPGLKIAVVELTVLLYIYYIRDLY